MKKLLGCAVVALALGLAAAAPAYADESSFLTELANDGFSGSSDAAVKMGHQICQDVAEGVPAQTTIQAIYQNTGDGVDQKDAQFVYNAAVKHLC